MSELNLTEEGFERYFQPNIDKMIKIELPSGRISTINMTIQHITSDLKGETGIVSEAKQKGIDHFKDALKVAEAYSMVLKNNNKNPNVNIHNGDSAWEQILHDINLANLSYKNDKGILCDLGHINIKPFKWGALPTFNTKYIYDPVLLGCVDGDTVYLCGYGTDTLLNVFSEKQITGDKTRLTFYGFENLHKIESFKDLLELN